MEITSILQAITTVGFPIVMCLFLLWFIKYLIDGHKAETKEFTDALNKNTLVLQQVCDLISVERDK